MTERANQTKDLSTPKQIGLALKLFASDNNGAFPSKAPAADYNAGTDLAAGAVSNDAFWWLSQLLEERGYLRQRRLEMVSRKSR